MIDTLPLLPDDRTRMFDSRYRVVLVSAQRAKQLMRGAQRAHTSKFTKETSVALEEVLGGHVNYLVGQEACQALREAKQSLDHDFPQSAPPAGDADAKAIKQELSVSSDDSPKDAAPASDAEGAA